MCGLGFRLEILLLSRFPAFHLYFVKVESRFSSKTADPACYYSVSRFYSRTLSLPDSRDHLEVLVDSLVVFWWSSSGLLMASNGNCTIQGSSPSETLSWNEDLKIDKNKVKTIKKSRSTTKHEQGTATEPPKRV